MKSCVSNPHIKYTYVLPHFAAINNNAVFSAQCSDRHFQCKNDECIHISFVCDSEPDCSDGSDENPEMCKKTGMNNNLKLMRIEMYHHYQFKWLKIYHSPACMQHRRKIHICNELHLISFEFVLLKKQIYLLNKEIINNYLM